MFERVDLRTRCAKVYDLEDRGRLRVVTSIQPQHVPTDVAAWRTGEAVTWEGLDLAFVARPGREFAIGKAWFTLTIPRDTVGYDYQSRVTGDRVSVHLQSIGGTSVSVPSPRLSGSEIWWDDVVPGLDFFVRAAPGRVELWKRIRTPSTPRVWTWALSESNPISVIVNHAAQGHDNADLADPARVGAGATRRRREVQLLHDIGQIDLTQRNERRYTVQETWTGKTIVRDKRTRVPSLSDEVVYPVLIDQDVSETIGVDNDDGFENGNAAQEGGWYLQWGGAGAHLFDGGSGYGFRPGYRFQTVAIPNGATIDAATFTVNCTFFAATANTGTLKGNNVDSAPAWANDAGPEDMSPTTAGVTNWGPTGTGTYAVNVAAIVQEIVNRPGWASGNNLALGVQGAVAGTGYTYISDFTGAVNLATLTVDYTAGGDPALGVLIGEPMVGSSLF